MVEMRKWIVSVACVSFAIAPRADADDLKSETGEVRFTRSLGKDRLLEEIGAANAKFDNQGARVVAPWGYGETLGYRVWDGETGQLLRRVKHAPQHVAFRVDIDESGGRFVTGGCFDFGERHELMRSHRDMRGCLVDIWEKREDRPARTLVADGQLGCFNVGLSRDGTRVACSDSRMNFKSWDTRTGKELASVASVVPPDEQPQLGKFSDDANRFVSIGRRTNTYKSFIYLCDLTTRSQRTIERIPADDYVHIVGPAIAGNGREFAVFVNDAVKPQIVIFGFETGRILDQFPAAGRLGVTMFACSSDGMTLAMGTQDGWLDVIERSSGRRVELRVSDGPVRAVAFLPGHDRVRVIAERAWISTNAARSEGHWAGPVRIADYRFRFPGP